MAEHQLNVGQLKEYGVIATKIRRQLEEAAEAQARSEMLFRRSQKDTLREQKEEVAMIGRLVRRRGTWVEAVRERYTPDDFSQPVPVGLRRRTGKRPPMSVAEKIQVVHQVLVGHDFQKDVAREHRISNTTVSKLVKKAVKNKDFLDELMQMQQEK